MEQKNDNMKTTENEKKPLNIKKIKRNLLIFLTMLLMVGSGFIGAGAHMIFRVPEAIPPCPTAIACPEPEPAWYSKLWDAVTPGTAIAEIPALVAPEPSSQPKSIFQNWWEEKFGQEQQTTPTQEEIVAPEIKLSDEEQEKADKELDKHTDALIEHTKNLRKIEKEVNERIKAIEKLTKEGENSSDVPPIVKRGLWKNKKISPLINLG
jgi:hypothetical protein